MQSRLNNDAIRLISGHCVSHQVRRALCVCSGRDGIARCCCWQNLWPRLLESEKIVIIVAGELQIGRALLYLAAASLAGPSLADFLPTDSFTGGSKRRQQLNSLFLLKPKADRSGLRKRRREQSRLLISGLAPERTSVGASSSRPSAASHTDSA